MKNIIYTDADLTAFLVANEEQSGNTIAVVIEADASANQELTITAGDASTTETVTPSTKNRIEIPLMLWNFGDDTVITLSKGGTDAGTITIHFPGAVDSDAALNETETDNEFTLQGSASVQEQIVSLQESVERVYAQTLAYILPSSVDQSGIADGGSNTVETFEFEAGAENVKVAFYTCVQFLAETTVTVANAYEDLMLTITITVDGVAAATILHTYRDGRQVLTINRLIENLSKGNHTMTVNFAAAGGSLSVMQIIAAYLLTAKSTNSGTVTEKNIFINGVWAPDVLADGLDAQRMTAEAYRAGILANLVKGYEFGRNSNPTYRELDTWFNSQYILWWHQEDGKMFYQSENYYTTDDAGTGYNRTEFCIPIKRVTGFSQIKYKAKTRVLHGSPIKSLILGAAAVVNGTFVRVMSPGANYDETWDEYTCDISSLPYVDYIMFFGNFGASAYKDITFVKQ